jgi:hypothetical protein
MNLASRCREAISQVQMLKREVASHRRKEQQSTRQPQPPMPTVAAKKPTTQPTASKQHTTESPRPTKLDLMKEMDRMDLILSSHPNGSSSPPPSPATPSPKQENMTYEETTPSPVSESSSTQPRLVSSDDYEEELLAAEQAAGKDQTPPPKMRALVTDDNDNAFPSILREENSSSPIDLDDSHLLLLYTSTNNEEEEEEEEEADRMPSPVRTMEKKTASQRRSSAGYNEEFPGDITAAAVRQQHHVSRLGRFQESPEAEDYTTTDAPPAVVVVMPQQVLNKQQKQTMDEAALAVEESDMKLGPFERMRQKAGTSTISSIDAFEASFNTNFPESFSPREDEAEDKPGATTTNNSHSSDSVSQEVYNPFSPSPQRPTMRSSSSTRMDQQVVPDYEPPAAGIRDRAEAALRRHRESSARWNGADPPGKDKTSSRWVGLSTTTTTVRASSMSQLPVARSPVAMDANENSSRSIHSPRLFSRTSPTAAGTTTKSSPVAMGMSRMKYQLLNGVMMSRSPKAETAPPPTKSESSVITSESSVSTQSYYRSSPVTPPPPSRKLEGASFLDSSSSPTVYRTPSPGGSGSLQPSPRSSTTLPVVEQPPVRPEKTGYDLGRARYEKALIPREERIQTDIIDDDNNVTAESVSPSTLEARASGVRAKIASFEATSPNKKDTERFPAPQRPRNLDALYSAAEVDLDDDGEIPMRSSIPKFDSSSRVALSLNGDTHSSRQRVSTVTSSSSGSPNGASRGIDHSGDDQLLIRPTYNTKNNGYDRPGHNGYESTIPGFVKGTKLVHERERSNWR